MQNDDTGNDNEEKWHKGDMPVETKTLNLKLVSDAFDFLHQVNGDYMLRRVDFMLMAHGSSGG